MSLRESLEKMNVAVKLGYPVGDQLRAMAGVMQALADDHVRVTKQFDELMVQLAALVAAVKMDRRLKLVKDGG